MRKETGITLTGIIIYVIAMVVVVSIIATVTSFFYTNVIQLKDNSDNISELTKFHMYFLEEVKDINCEITRLEDNAIQFRTGNTFSFQNNAIYYNHVKICENVSNLQFDVENINNHQVIRVLVSLGNSMEYTKTTEYVVGE